MANERGSKEGQGSNEFNSDTVARELGTVLPSLRDDVRKKFVSLFGEVVKFNSSAGLVSSKGVSSFAQSHVYDCVEALKLIQLDGLSNKPVYDVASGNGFPGLVLAVLKNEASVKIVEPDKKRIAFLESALKSLNLTNVEIMSLQLEDLPVNSVEQLITRGSISLAKLLFAARKAVLKKGRFFHLKSDSWSTELVSVPAQLLSVWAPRLLGQYRLPDSGAQMAVLLTEKIS